MINLILNVIWLLTTGWAAGLAWLLAAALMAISIVGLPWARAAFNIAIFSFWPFGRTAVSRETLTGREDIGTGALGGAGNVVWLIFAGWWLALGHLGLAVANAVTIIGLPFAWQHLKLAGVSLWPVGKAIVDVDIADEARRRAAARTVDGYRR